jgi:hypothetical protein
VNHVHRRLLGESLREIGVLVLVFVPLDMLLRENAPDSYLFPPWMFWLRWLSMAHWVELFFGMAGIFLLYYGIKIETDAILEEQEGDNRDDVPDPGV